MRTREFKAIQKKMIKALTDEFLQLEDFVNTCLPDLEYCRTPEELLETLRSMEENDYWNQPALKSFLNDALYKLTNSKTKKEL